MWEHIQKSKMPHILFCLLTVKINKEATKAGWRMEELLKLLGLMVFLFLISCLAQSSVPCRTEHLFPSENLFPYCWSRQYLDPSVFIHCHGARSFKSPTFVLPTGEVAACQECEFHLHFCTCFVCQKNRKPELNECSHNNCLCLHSAQEGVVPCLSSPAISISVLLPHPAVCGRETTSPDCSHRSVQSEHATCALKSWS